MQQSGTPVVGSGGTGNEISIPGSRNGRGTPGSTVKVSPNSFVGATETRESACNRMHSNRSSWDFGPAGSRMVVVSVTAEGKVLIGESTMTSPGRLLSSCVKSKNSLAVPLTVTAFPTTTAGTLEVKTNRASDVAGSLSTLLSGACKKNPFDFLPVTMPLVLTSCPR